MFNEISLSKFLARYCNLTGKDLSRLTHTDVSILFPALRRVERREFETCYDDEELMDFDDSLDECKEYETLDDLVISGRAMLVNDGRRVVPYYVPEINRETLEEPMELNMEVVDTTIHVDNARHDYTKMNIYELRNMLRRKFNSGMNQRNARRELERRGVVLSKKYNRVEEKRKIERMKNERY